MKCSDAQIIAKNILKEECLEDWSFGFDHAKKRFGVCNYTAKSISLSRHLVELNDEKVVRDTIIHEIAHAIAGHEAGHGKFWKQCVVRMGGVPERCYSPKEVNTPQMKYSLICPQCDLEISRARKPKKSVFKTLPACLPCCKTHNNGKFSRKFVMEVRENY